MAARDELDALLASDDNVDLETLMNAARAHLLLGDGQGAEERVQRAQKLPPAPQAAEELLDLHARALLVEHKPAEAAAMLRKAVPNALRGETLALLMDAYLDLEQPDRAAEVVRMAPPRARVGVELLVARARLAIERGRDSVAEGFAQEAIARMRGPRAPRALKAEAYAILGRSQYEQGSFRLALRSLKAATELDPRMARAWYYLGLVDFDLRAWPMRARRWRRRSRPIRSTRDAWYYLGAHARGARATRRRKRRTRSISRSRPRGLRRRGARGAQARQAARRRSGYADQFSASNPSPGTVTASAPSAG